MSPSTVSVSCYAALDKGDTLKPWDYETREITASDVLIDILYSGICGSDIHVIDNDWNSSIYPVVPGHEIIGRVAEGSGSSKHPIGSIVGVGPQVYSCGSCTNCQADKDPLCSKRVFTYSDKFIDGSITYGGYARQVLVNEEYAIEIPDGMDLSRAAPLLCAGATVFSPLRCIPKNSSVGIVGIGHRVSAISHSPRKEREAKDLGAESFILIDKLENFALSFNYLLVTSSHGLESIDGLLSTLKFDGSLTLVALPAKQIGFTPSLLVSFNRKIMSSLILGKKRHDRDAELCSFALYLPNYRRIWH
ncbi:hypothetical protein MDAP_002634 [Mitosporidium daphniae]